MAIQITSPADGADQKKGKAFQIQFDQEVHSPPAPSSGVVSARFSDDPAGPWTTCRGFGQGGALEVQAQPWTAQQQGGAVSAKLYEGCYFQVGVWEDQELSGEPFDESDVIFQGVIGMEPPIEP